MTRIGKFFTNLPRSVELLEHPEKVSPGNILNGWNPLSSNPKINKIKDYNSLKNEARKEETPVASTSKPQVSQPPKEGKNKKKNNFRNPYSPDYRIPRIPKYAMDNVFNMFGTLMEFKDKEEQIMRKPHFPKKSVCLLMF
ncbi:hypothetical protein O181_123278 [Austropuccinia psidii MF-1]|uniref:Uncharacterized protein n=1 Tax=Austropuccinia psidii MF-1 TaxID=1389203 RepID=A0A9Q3Q304_9BASI|nr:hypothetical protein [Austropuccinia psidii MF-1]